jgi:hypothetical protein
MAIMPLDSARQALKKMTLIMWPLMALMNPLL